MVQHHYFVLCFLILEFVGVVVCKAWMDTSLSFILEHLKMDEVSVLEHQLVKLHSPDRKHKRDLGHGTQIHFQAFDDEYKLSLHSRESFLISKETQVCFARYALGYPNDVQCRMLENAMEGVGTPMGDPNNQASIIVGSDDFGSMTVNGHFRSKRDNTRLVIRSLPEEIVVGYHLRKRRSVADVLNSPSINSTNHIVLKLSHDDSQMDHAYRVRAERDSNKQIVANRSGKYLNHDRIDTVYPKIFVHVHHSISGDGPSARKKLLLDYILTFWNSVDLINRPTKNPRIRLHIAVIMIAEEPRATPYIFDNMLKKNDTHYMGSDALDQASRFYFLMKDTFRFDIAVTMTKLTLLTYDPLSKHLLPFNGLAFQAGACYHNDTQYKGVALAMDNGGYSGVTTAAHEVAHVIGAYHESDEPPHDQCQQQKDFLMERTPRTWKNQNRISKCSIYDFRKRFEAGLLACMYDKPPMEGKILANVMAGKPLDKNGMCERASLGPSCEPDKRYSGLSCAILHCKPLDGKDSCRATSFIIPSGTPCRTARDNVAGMCLNYDCVPI